MARIYDERFDELTGLVKRVVGRVDEMQLEMRDMRKDSNDMRTESGGMRKDMGEMRTETRAMSSGLREHSSRFDRLEAAIQVFSGRQEDVISKVVGIQETVNRISVAQAEQASKIVELTHRLDAVDRRLNGLDERMANLESEVTEIRKTIDSLIDPVLDGKTLWASIRHIEERIARLEEKVI